MTKYPTRNKPSYATMAAQVVSFLIRRGRKPAEIAKRLGYHNMNNVTRMIVNDSTPRGWNRRSAIKAEYQVMKQTLEEEEAKREKFAPGEQQALEERLVSDAARAKLTKRPHGYVRSVKASSSPVSNTEVPVVILRIEVHTS